MKAALDVYYRTDGSAKAVCLLFADWADEIPARIFFKTTNGIAPYEPGRFYKRELPCLLDVLREVTLETLDTIVIDGYVYLTDDVYGLGGRLYEALNKLVPVIGVAKTKFRGSNKNVIEVRRGDSHRPLYVTAIGTDLSVAASHIERMAGEHRLPTLLRLLDRHTKEERSTG